MRLPPLNAIRAFEAVCRLGSISKAAEELSVVRGAVRQHLTTLEAYFGEKLFERSGRNVLPLAKAVALAEASTAALGALARASAIFENGERAIIRIGVPSAFALWWMMPRIGEIQEAMGSIELRIVPMPIAQSLALHPDLDAVIMGGEYHPAVGVSALRFMEDNFGPVISAEVAVRLGSDYSEMADLTLLTSRSAPNLWQDWVNESGSQELQFAREQSFEDLLLAIGAARSGLGIVVAPKASIEGDLARGELVAPYGFTRRPAGYTFCCRTGDAKTGPFVALARWLTQAGNGLE